MDSADDQSSASTGVESSSTEVDSSAYKTDESGKNTGVDSTGNTDDSAFDEELVDTASGLTALEHISALEQEMDTKYGTRIRKNMRPRRKRQTVPNKFKEIEGQMHALKCNSLSMKDYARMYSKIHSAGTPDSQNIMKNDAVVATILTQHHVSKGLKVFGDQGVQAVLKEIRQLHDRMVIDPTDSKLLTREEKEASLQYLMFLKEKRCGKIKGRGCADGRKQRVYMSKEDSSSPTVSTEALFLTCLIDAMEKRDVATVDIPGAFMQSDMEGRDTYMKIEGKMVDILSKVDPSLYEEHATIENGKKVLYVKLKKALYGTVQASLLFWKNLTETLVSWGFEINPYDWCVANKMVDGKQLTITWHVDDLKISHVDEHVVTKLIEQLNDKYGKEACGKEVPLTVKRGKKHEYLGMVLDYTTEGKVRVDMRDYLKKNVLSELPEDFSGTAVTPAGIHLFDVDPNAEKLNKSDSELFHHVVAQLLFVCKRGRPDLQTAVAFLTTRVKNPDIDDMKKLKRAIAYVRETIELVLTLETDKLMNIYWWVDASFAVHPDAKSHTGGTMSLGGGLIYSASRKQKLNTRSSTEAELVGVDDMMAQVLWTRYFMLEQGYELNDNIIYQDNQSAIKLENNGRHSSGKRTRHLKIRFFFVTDRIGAKEINIEYCPTELLIADFFTKPLQGAQFRKLRNAILNIKDGTLSDVGNMKKEATVPVETATLCRPQECVGQNVNKELNKNVGLKKSYCGVCKEGIGVTGSKR